LRARAAALVHVLPDYLGIALEAVRNRHTELLHVVQGVILVGDRVLLARRNTLRGFELPGGNLHPGEDAIIGLERELREETGLEIEVEASVGTYYRSGFLAHRADVYRCRARGGTLRPSRETPELAWFAVDSLPDDLFPWFRTPLVDALAGRCAVERREHQGLGAIWAGLCIDLRARWRA
jgi:8-oxo-dGTP diphosphatase